MMRVSWRSLRWLVGGTVLGAVLWGTGVGPFLVGVRSLDLGDLALGAAIALPTTVACAWRWQLVARGVGVDVEMRDAVASCYRAQFLNVTLPGGVLGDVHRGVRHGRDAGDIGRGLRAVMWERVAGQVVQAIIAIVVLLLLPSPVQPYAPALIGLLAVGLVAAWALQRARRVQLTSPLGRILRALRDDVRQGLLAHRAWPGVVLASSAAVVGHVSTYLVAARAVGVTTSLVAVLPLAVLVLVVAGLPLNVAGWGPREGMAAWSFAVAGLGADQGVATAVAYGAMVIVASLPGAVLLMAAAARPAGARVVESAPARPRVAEGGRIHG